MAKQPVGFRTILMQLALRGRIPVRYYNRRSAVTQRYFSATNENNQLIAFGHPCITMYRPIVTCHLADFSVYPFLFRWIEDGYHYFRRRRLCFHFGLFVCLFVCSSDNWKSCERIMTKFLGGVGHGPGTNEFNFGDDPDNRPEPGVRNQNPDSLDYRITNGFWWNFIESWGVA